MIEVLILYKVIAKSDFFFKFCVFIKEAMSFSMNLSRIESIISHATIKAFRKIERKIDHKFYIDANLFHMYTKGKTFYLLFIERLLILKV